MVGEASLCVGASGDAFLWVRFSNQPPLITDLEFSERPRDVKKAREDAKYLQDYRLCVHEAVPVQIRCFWRKDASRICGVKIAHTKEHADEYYRMGYTLAKNLSVFGCKTSVWTMREKYQGILSVRIFLKVIG